MKTNIAELFCCFESSQLLFTVSYVNGPDEAREKRFGMLSSVVLI